MTKYLVLYRAPMSAREQIANATPEQAQAGMDAWMQWAGRTGDALVDLGAPLQDISGDDGEIAGFSILEADSSDAARGLVKDHPHLQTPGGSIELLEFLPIPGM